MKQFIGTMLIGGAIAFVMIKEKLIAVSANLMNEALEEDRRKKLSARRSGR